MARKSRKEEYYRFFTVTEPRAHEKGHTEYKVTARFVSKKRPEDVKEVVVWRRYTELKKLHGELAYTHRNLFRKQEEFPPFPRAQLFGRFDETVIEERRKAAEAMLHFTSNIPALYNSPQLKEFFREGEVKRPLDPSVSSSTSLPPPLIPLPNGDTGLGAEEETGREAPILTQELESTLSEKEFGEPEIAVEALSNMDISPVEEIHEEQEEAEVTCITDQPAVPSPKSPGSPLNQSEFDSLFDSEEPLEGAKPLLSENDLAIFDPCAKEDQSCGSPGHAELLSLQLTTQDSGLCVREADYVVQAIDEMTAAQVCEKEGDHSTAIMRYRTAVEIFMKGIQGDVDPQQRDAVKRRVAECLEHAERLLSSQTPTHQHNT